MKVRPATLDDTEALAELHVRTWQTAYAGIIPEAYLAKLEVNQARIANWRARITQVRAGTALLVAEVDGTAAGFSHAGPYRADVPEPGAAEVYAIYVDPGHWSTGAGRALMDASLADLEDHGFVEVRLWVLEDNARARRFYERAGFALDGARKPDEFDGVPAIEVRYARPVR